jgi:hypothetical protein
MKMPGGGVISKANADLMAAAPDLLEALKALVNARWMVSVDWCPQENYDAVMEVANSAIAKAEGK